MFDTSALYAQLLVSPRRNGFWRKKENVRNNAHRYRQRFAVVVGHKKQTLLTIATVPTGIPKTPPAREDPCAAHESGELRPFVAFSAYVASLTNS